MKKAILISLIILLVSLLTAEYDLNVTTVGNSAIVRLDNIRADFEDDVIRTIVAIPSNSVNISINSMQVSTFDLEGNMISRNSEIDPSLVTVADSFIMRELHGFTLDIQRRSFNNNQMKLVESIDLEVTGTGYVGTPSEICESFKPLYRSLVDNFETSYLNDLLYAQPKILILSHDNTQISNALQPYIDWKRARGFQVEVIFKSAIGTNPSNVQIRNHVADYYNNADVKPNHLLIIGDVSGSFSYPTFFIGPNNDAADLPYALIEGDDFFPEMFVGRFSILSPLDLATMVNKTIYYERDIYMGDTDWMERGLVVAGNYANNIIPVTPVLMSRWLSNLWMEFGYTEVDSVYYWPGIYDGFQTQEVINAVNRSAQFINYRGWGATNGWHYPRFYSDHLEGTFNNGRLPVVFSIVCNTGDFAHPSIEECFGEVWMKLGTPGTMNGAVAFFGPSDLYTSTEYNNAISSGIHWGIQVEDITHFGAACLRGKLELYRGYPNEHGDGEMVEFYFHIYNLLSDPSLNMWKLIPGTLDIVLPDYIEQGTNYIDFDLPGLNEGFVTVTRDNQHFKKTRIENGYAIIELDPYNTEDLTVTITHRKHIPIQQTISVNTSSNISISDYSFSRELLQPGENVTVSVTFKNFHSEEYQNVEVELTSPVEEIGVITDNIVLGNISSMGTVEADFEFSIDSSLPRFSPILLDFYITPSNNNAKIVTMAGGIHLEIENYNVLNNNGFLNPGDTADIEIYIKNHGDFDAVGLVGVVDVGTNALQVNTESIDIGNINVGETGSAILNVTVEDNCFIGRLAWFDIDFTDSTGMLSYSSFYTVIGEVDNTHPTGPDRYGYYAYDSFDTDYEFAPVYNWINIDPEDGGNGTVLYIGDDEAAYADLPFTFRYYGRDYNEFQVVDNGWITFMPTWETNFRNWPLPAPLAPKGIIAPFWDDIKGLPENDDLIRVIYYHDEANNRFIISWHDSYNIGDRPNYEVPEKFQIILEPRGEQDGDIIFQYKSVWNNNHTRNFSTTGIMNHNGGDGLTYVYAMNYPASSSEIQPGLAIRFTTDSPDGFTSTFDDSLVIENGPRVRNYPNPFNPDTNIVFTLPESTEVKLEVFNILGQKITTLVNEKRESGTHLVVWKGDDKNGNNVASGIYFYRLKTSNTEILNKMLLLK